MADDTQINKSDIAEVAERGVGKKKIPGHIIISETTEPKAKWYVVHTYSGYENKVATDLMTTAENRNLQDMIIDVKVPVEIVTETVGDKTKEVENKLFPGYVFVKMVYTDETWYVVRNIRGCTGFVGPGSKPVPLTDAEVYRMGVETRSVKLNYSVGDSVRIIDGPLEDFVGVVEEIDADKIMSV